MSIFHCTYTAIKLQGKNLLFLAELFYLWPFVIQFSLGEAFLYQYKVFYPDKYCFGYWDHKLREMSALQFLHYSFSFFLYAQGIEIDCFSFWNDESAAYALVGLSREWVNIGNRMGEFTEEKR